MSIPKMLLLCKLTCIMHATFILFLCTCKRNPTRVVFIIPSGFEGLIEVKEDASAATPGQPTVKISVDGDGVAVVKSRRVLEVWHELSAFFADGRPIPLGFLNPGDANEICGFFALGRLDDLVKGTTTDYYFVGTSTAALRAKRLLIE